MRARGSFKVSLSWEGEDREREFEVKFKRFNNSSSSDLEAAAVKKSQAEKAERNSSLVVRAVSSCKFFCSTFR